MTKEELKKHARCIIDALDDLAVIDQLDVIGLAYEALGFTLATAEALEDKEHQQEILTAIDKHLESIRATIYALCATSIIGGKSEFLKDIANTKKEEKK